MEITKPNTPLFTRKRKQAFGLPHSCLTCTRHGKCVDMTARVLDLLFFFFFSFFLGEKWTLQDTVGTCHVLPKKKKKSITHYLSYQSPPTSSHTDLLRRQSSSHSDLFFFSFSSIYFSFTISPFALILVLFVFLLFLSFFFTLSHL